MKTNQSFHFPPTAGMIAAGAVYSWEGKLDGSETEGWGFKAKLDDLGRLWFILVDSGRYYTKMFLVCATRISDTVISYQYADFVDLVGVNPNPNQLTIDHSFNVYIAGGDRLPSLIKVDTSGSPWVATIYTPQGAAKVLCCTLSKDHSKVGFYWDDGNIPYVTVLNTATMLEFTTRDITDPLGGPLTPFNFETIIGSVVWDDFLVFVVPSVAEPGVGKVVMIDINTNDALSNVNAVTVHELVVAVDNNTVPNVYTMERYERCPGLPNRIYRYPTDTFLPVLLPMTCAPVQEKMPKHHDLRRSKPAINPIYVATGAAPADTGEIREVDAVTGAEVPDIHTHLGFRQICTALPRGST